MHSGGDPAVLMVPVLGLLIIFSLLAKAGLRKIGLPSLVGFLVLGLGLNLADHAWRVFDDRTLAMLEFMGKLGLVMLLFRVGLESHIEGLVKQLRRASLVWVADIAISGVLGFAAAFYVLELTAVTSLIVATAFTATSVGISVAVWQEMGVLQSRDGELLVDVAEMDDISAVVLMALLFAVLPSLKNGFHLGGDLLFQLAGRAGASIFKLLVFGGICLLFSRYAEKRMTAWFQKLDKPPDPMLMIVGIGLLVAAFAAWLGFSMAIGAFFAGLVFSRDPEAVKMESSFMPLYDLFSPFFFISVGLQMKPASLLSGAAMGGVLVVAAAGGKLLADGLPVLALYGWQTAVLIGLSMIPRAEISMVIMQNSMKLGQWAVPPDVYSAMVIVSFLTCALAPVIVRALLKTWRQPG